MGIQGLLPFLKEITRSVNIREYHGSTVAVDGYCWLHKGAFSCAEKLAQKQSTDQYVQYCMKLVNMLIAAGVKPIIVFDGCNLPAKKITESKRREQRHANRLKATELLEKGDKGAARKYIERSIDITPEMAHAFIVELRSASVDYIIAPYEADAQLAYLSQAGLADIIITEDSDLIAFGCANVLYKMDQKGDGRMISRRDLPKIMQLNTTAFTFDRFRHMCILSGCDYLPSLPGIGLGKAYRACKLAKQTDVRLFVKQLPMYLKGSVPITEEYVDNFVKADQAFRHQLIFNPLDRKLQPLTPYDEDFDSSQPMGHCGTPMENEYALQIAIGNVNVSTGLRHDSFNIDSWEVTVSIWHPATVAAKRIAVPSMIAPDRSGEDLDSEEVALVKQVRVNNLNAPSGNKENTPPNLKDDLQLITQYAAPPVQTKPRGPVKSKYFAQKREPEPIAYLDDTIEDPSMKYDHDSPSPRRQVTTSRHVLCPLTSADRVETSAGRGSLDGNPLYGEHDDACEWGGRGFENSAPTTQAWYNPVEPPAGPDLVDEVDDEGGSEPDVEDFVAQLVKSVGSKRTPPVKADRNASRLLNSAKSRPSSSPKFGHKPAKNAFRSPLGSPVGANSYDSSRNNSQQSKSSQQQLSQTNDKLSQKSVQSSPNVLSQGPFNSGFRTPPTRLPSTSEQYRKAIVCDIVCDDSDEDDDCSIIESSDKVNVARPPAVPRPLIDASPMSRKPFSLPRMFPNPPPDIPVVSESKLANSNKIASENSDDQGETLSVSPPSKRSKIFNNYSANGDSQNDSCKTPKISTKSTPNLASNKRPKHNLKKPICQFQYVNGRLQRNTKTHDDNRVESDSDTGPDERDDKVDETTVKTVATNRVVSDEKDEPEISSKPVTIIPTNKASAKIKSRLSQNKQSVNSAPKLSDFLSRFVYKKK